MSGSPVKSLSSHPERRCAAADRYVIESGDRWGARRVATTTSSPQATEATMARRVVDGRSPVLDPSVIEPSVIEPSVIERHDAIRRRHHRFVVARHDHPTPGGGHAAQLGQDCAAVLCILVTRRLVGQHERR